MDNATRAPAGGTIGVNGEFYEGGKFLPSNANRAKQAPVRFPAGGKCEVAPYVWEKRPADGMQPLFGVFRACVDGWYLRKTGIARIPAELQGARHVNDNRAEIESAMAKFNAGERWQ